MTQDTLDDLDFQINTRTTATGTGEGGTVPSSYNCQLYLKWSPAFQQILPWFEITITIRVTN